MTGKWTIKKLNRHDGKPLPMPWHAIPPHTPIPPRELSHHSMRVLYEDDDVGTGVTHGEVMAYVNEQIRGGSMNTTPPREESEMTTNEDRAQRIETLKIERMDEGEGRNLALIEGLRELAQEMRERALPDIGDDWGDAMTEAAIMVEKFIEDTGATDE